MQFIPILSFFTNFDAISQATHTLFVCSCGHNIAAWAICYIYQHDCMSFCKLFSGNWHLSVSSLNMNDSSLLSFMGDMKTCFTLSESTFAANSIAPKVQQLHILLGVVPPFLTVTMKDLIAEPPHYASCRSMKKEILWRTSLSKEGKFETLISNEHLGNHKPL